jgi:hypothetical protein
MRMRPAGLSSDRQRTSPFAETAAPNAAEALRALSTAIRKRGRYGSDGEGLRALVVAYCDHAPNERLTPERMLIGLKRALEDALTAVSDDPMRRDAPRARVVTLAIDAFYDGRR